MKIMKRDCDNCGRYYEGQGKRFCSYTCAGYPHLENRKIKKETRPETIERFMKKVKKKDTGCWEWSAGLRNGYGSFSYKGKEIYSHRVSLMLLRGEVITNKYVCHHCDNPKCVNPDHLFLGTQKDNMRDRKEKGRHRWTDEIRKKAMPNGTHGHQKLTPEQVRFIRDEYKKTSITLKMLAENFGVGEATISNIVNYRTYAYME